MIHQPLEAWLDVLVLAANELAVETLGFEAGCVVARNSTVAANLTSSCIALVGEESVLQLGFAATMKDCSLLSSALLGLCPEEELSHEDMVDALGELTNVLAGLVKTRLASTLRIGLPIVLKGSIDTPTRMESATATMRWGDIEAQLLLLRSKAGEIR